MEISSQVCSHINDVHHKWSCLVISNKLPAFIMEQKPQLDGFIWLLIKRLLKFCLPFGKMNSKRSDWKGFSYPIAFNIRVIIFCLEDKWSGVGRHEIDRAKSGFQNNLIMPAFNNIFSFDLPVSNYSHHCLFSISNATNALANEIQHAVLFLFLGM